MMVRTSLVVLFLGMHMLACNVGVGSYSPDEYKAYVDGVDNGFIKSQTVGEFKLSVKLLPPEYLAIQNFGNGFSNEKDFHQEVNTNRPFYHFMLRIEGIEQKSEDPLERDVSHEEYQRRLGYLITAIDDDLKVIDGKDTLSCIMHHLERSYHMTSFHNIQCVFERKDITSLHDLQFVLDDQILNIGKVVFPFERQTLDSPTIIF